MPDLTFFTEMMVLGALTWMIAGLVARDVFHSDDGPLEWFRYPFKRNKKAARAKAQRDGQNVEPAVVANFATGAVAIAIVYISGSFVETLSHSMMETRWAMRLATIPVAIAFRVPGVQPSDVPDDVLLDPTHTGLVQTVYAGLCRDARAMGYTVRDGKARRLCPGWKDDATFRFLAQTHAHIHKVPEATVPFRERGETHYRLARGMLLISFVMAIFLTVGWIVSRLSATGTWLLVAAIITVQVSYLSLMRAEIEYHEGTFHKVHAAEIAESPPGVGAAK